MRHNIYILRYNIGWAGYPRGGWIIEYRLLPGIRLSGAVSGLLRTGDTPVALPD